MRSRAREVLPRVRVAESQIPLPHPTERASRENGDAGFLEQPVGELLRLDRNL